jgi:adenylate cyclase
MSGSRKRAVYAIGGFCLDPGRRLLTDAGGRPIAVTAKAFDALVYLAEHAGELVQRSALVAALWPKTVVEENNLSQAISSLRRVLGEGIIITVPGRGYQLVAEVREIGDPMGAAQESPPPVTASRPAGEVASDGFRQGATDAQALVDRVTQVPRPSTRSWRFGVSVGLVLLAAGYLFFAAYDPPTAVEPRAQASRDRPTSIAVLPFINLSSDPEQEYFSDGLSEDLMSRLARFEDLLVTARTSSFAFKGRTQDIATIGAQLGVEHVLEGSVDKAGSRLRIRASLIETTGGKRLWTDSYERELGDIFQIYDEISYAVAGALQITLRLDEGSRPAGGTDNVVAYEHYLFGQRLQRTWTPAYQAQMIAAYQKAIELDRDFGLARVALANAYGQASVWGVPNAAALRDDAIRTAVEMVVELPQTDILRAQQFVRQWKIAEADEHYQRALARLPNDYPVHTFYSAFLGQLGYMREALRYSEMAHRLDPLAMMPVHGMAIAAEALGDPDQARVHYENTRSLLGNQMIPKFEQIYRLSSAGAFEEARDLYREIRVEAGPGTTVFDSSMELLEDPTSARALLRKFYSDPVYTDVASVTGITRWAAHFGDAELALAGLSKANEVDHILMGAIWGRSWQTVRADPAFKRFASDLGLVAYWREAGWPDKCRPLGDDDFECF